MYTLTRSIKHATIGFTSEKDPGWTNQNVEDNVMYIKSASFSSSPLKIGADCTHHVPILLRPVSLGQLSQNKLKVFS